MSMRLRILTAISAAANGRSHQDLCDFFSELERERINCGLTLLVCEGVIAANAARYTLTDAGRTAMSAAHQADAIKSLGVRQ